MHAGCAAIAAAFALLPLAAAAQSAPQIETLRVTRTTDDGEGSLRWAIERNNTAPGRFRIEINKAVSGAINGGGPDVEMRSFTGDIFVRSAGK